MNQLNFKSNIWKFNNTKRRGVAEVISTLLLVVITVVGAVILTQFMDETFVSGSIGVSSSTDSTLKTVKLTAYDTRDGFRLMGYDDINNDPNLELCRDLCTGDDNPQSGGSEFLMIQIENKGIKPIFLKNLYLDNVNYPWDPATSGTPLDTSGTSAGGAFPDAKRFSILSEDSDGFVNPPQLDNEIQGGQRVNLLIKLDTDNPGIPTSKTMRVQLNIGANSLAEFLIESGDAR